jgi:hypothetical protein
MAAKSTQQRLWSSLATPRLQETEMQLNVVAIGTHVVHVVKTVAQD